LVYRIGNTTELASGTRIPPILGGVDPREARTGRSVEELIAIDPSLAGRSLNYVIEHNPVISILEQRDRTETTGLAGGGNLHQSYFWQERFFDCGLTEWPFVLAHLDVTNAPQSNYGYYGGGSRSALR
jgi:hypothetical protein